MSLRSAINLIGVALITVPLAFLPACKSDNQRPVRVKPATAPNKTETDLSRLRAKSEEAERFCNANNLNSRYYFLVDLARHSGLKRFYVWDFKNDTIITSFLVSHGCGKNPWRKDYSKENAATSNREGTHLSSVGKYIIGERGYSEFGIHIKYLLHGLDNTNSNALRRLIVLHSWEEVPEKEVFPDGTPEGWGCPAVSNRSMELLDNMLQNSENKVLLWIIK